MKLESRLHAGLAVSLIVLMAALGWAQYSVIEKLTQSIIYSRAEHDSQSLLASMIFDETGNVSLNEIRLANVYQQPFSGHYYQINLVGEQPIRSRSLWDIQLDIEQQTIGETAMQHQAGPDGQNLLIHIASYVKQEQTITIAIAEDITPVQQQLRYYEGWFVGIVLVGLLGLLMIQRMIVHMSFRPLQQIQQEVINLSEGKLGKLSDRVPDEIQPVVNAVNHLLFVMGERLQRSRNAVGNLAHSLKAPLTILTQLADEQGTQDSAMQKDLLKQTDRMQDIINHELKRARLAGSGMAGQKFIPQQDIPDLLQVLQQMYRDKPIQVDCQIEEGTFGDTDRDDMLELMGNLLENSFKWAQGQIRCTVSMTPTLQIVVEDDGPGCDEQQLQVILQRGNRLDEQTPGYGLGMSIIKEIAALYQFELVMGRSQSLGGLRVRLQQSGGLE